MGLTEAREPGEAVLSGLMPFVTASGTWWAHVMIVHEPFDQDVPPVADRPDRRPGATPVGDPAGIAVVPDPSPARKGVSSVS